ncbi:MAG TPA: hypothetical protein VGD79_07370 [Thermoanaerobaculia bacterium]
MKKFLAAFALVVLACGKRGDPRPPVPMIPAATSDLVVTQRADRVLLSWSYPALSTAGKNLTDVKRISIYRYEEPLPVVPGGRDPKTLMPGDVDTTKAQPVVLFSRVPTVPQAQFAKLSTRIDSIEKANLADATTGARLLFHDTPPFRSSDGRPVRLTYAVVTEGAEARSQVSNLATIVPLAVGIPPAGLTATAKAEGVTLTWTTPQQAVGNLGAPVVTGYNVYRTAPGKEPGELDVAINTAPVTATTYTDAPGYGEHEYRVAAVATTGPPLVQSDLSAPTKVNFRDLVAPPAPATVTALLETKLVRLLWDAVDAPDLAGYNVYRIEGKFRLKLTPSPLKDPNFLDISIDIGISYSYEVTAVDASGNESKPAKTETVIVPKTP